MITPHEIGQLGEKAAKKYLRKLEYSILQSNYTCKFGEIDIIAFQKGVISFVEVKTRTSDEWGQPYEAVDSAKQKKIIRTAQFYIKKKKPGDYDYRFDIIAINMDRQGKVLDCEFYKNAFTLDQS